MQGICRGLAIPDAADTQRIDQMQEKNRRNYI